MRPLSVDQTKIIEWGAQDLEDKFEHAKFEGDGY